MKKFFLMIAFVGVFGCASKNCREIREAEAAASGKPVVAPEITKEKDPMNKSAQADRVRVYKPDGSLQCGQGKAVPLDVMQKQLGSIKVHTAYNKHDGMMRPQVCGHATGFSNVYEIDRKDLPAAQKAGFKEWIAE